MCDSPITDQLPTSTFYSTCKQSFALCKLEQVLSLCRKLYTNIVSGDHLMECTTANPDAASKAQTDKQADCTWLVKFLDISLIMFFGHI